MTTVLPARILTEHLVPLPMADQFFPAPVPKRTLYLIATHRPDKPRLETVDVAGRLHTSKEAIQRYLAASNPHLKISPPA